MLDEVACALRYQAIFTGAQIEDRGRHPRKVCRDIDGKDGLEPSAERGS